MNKASAGKHYQAINAQTGVVDADPHRLIQMLYAGALDQISVAKGCMQRRDLAGRALPLLKRSISSVACVTASTRMPAMRR